MGEIVYRRKLSAEEVNEGFLFITKEGLKRLPAVSETFKIRISDREFEVKIDAGQKIHLKEITEFPGLKKGAEIAFVKEAGEEGKYWLYALTKQLP
ncbi:MAG: hypothetical protein A7316_00115 [Candidatus Altiarchaeales archaeon WOR_SM1_86-2]|nr:MAG: hypothetical protein A7316_00115 [Candidatus Altiarchaeales archaeon WOR_SM1_86-2]